MANDELAHPIHEAAATNAAEEIAFDVLPTADTPATGEPSGIDALLADATDANEILRLTAQLPGEPNELARPEVKSGVRDADFPPGEAEPDGHLDEVAAAAAAGKALPSRLRIAGLPEAKRRLIASLADPNKSVEDVLRELSPAHTAEAASTIPGLETGPEDADIDPASLVAPRESSAALLSHRSSLREARAVALEGMNLREAARLEREIDALETRLPEVRRNERVYSEAFDRVVDASQRRALDLFPAAADPNSALTREMSRLDKQMESSNHPSFNSPDKFEVLASLAAARLGIAPRPRTARQGTTGTPAPVAAPVPRAAVPGTSPINPAAGGARTAAPSHVAAAQAFDQLLNSAQDSNDIAMLTRGL